MINTVVTVLVLLQGIGAPNIHRVPTLPLAEASEAPLLVSSTGGFVLPAGETATLSNTLLGYACNALTYGYQLRGGTFTALGSKPYGCTAVPQADATIGPHETSVEFVLILNDDTCGHSFDSTGGHALVTGDNPYEVDISDAGFYCEAPAGTTRPPGSSGNLSTTVTIAEVALPSLTAVPAWYMPERTVDSDGDGLIDKYIDGNRTADVPTDGRYTIFLDACRSTGDIARYSWMMGSLEIANSDQCLSTALLPEGTKGTVKLTVTGAGGTDSASFQINVVDHLIVSLGDSYAAGQGNPDLPQRSVTEQTQMGPVTYTAPAVWKDGPCYRSAKAGPALAALALERGDPHSSVTFVHLACSGATVEGGLLGAQKDDEDKNVIASPQLSSARSIVGGQPIDAMTLSIGGNDVYFVGIIERCLIFNDCPLNTVDAKDFDGGGRLHDAIQRALGRLSGKFEAVNECLRTGQCSVSDTHYNGSVRLDTTTPLLVTDYADVTKGRDGSYCSENSLSSEEFRWTDKVMLTGQAGTFHDYPIMVATGPRSAGPGVLKLPVISHGLNTQIDGLASLSWTPVQTYEAFQTHGYCAEDASWIRSLTQSWRLQGNFKGAFHPNERGHQEIGRLLEAQLRSAIGI